MTGECCFLGSGLVSFGLAVALSKEAIKNLLDAMQKVSLGIIAVAVGLLSNVLISQDSVEKKAQPELEALLKIRDNVARYTVASFLAAEQRAALAKSGQPVERRRRQLQGKMKTGIGLLLSNDVSFSIPTDFRVTSHIDRQVAERKFSDIQNLEEMRAAWNAIASTKKFWKLDTRPSQAFIQLEKDPTTTLEVEWVDLKEIDEGTSSTSDTGVLSLTKNENGRVKANRDGGTVWIDYEFLPALAGAVDSDKLMKSFGLKDEQRDFLKLAYLSVGVDAKPASFSPALALDPVLGAKTDFADAFPNLEKLPDLYQSQKLRSLGTSLAETVAQQPKAELEIFGAKLPSDLIALLGLPVLAILLFQFSAIGFYCASRAKRLDDEDASHWSFTLSSWPFAVVSCGTLFVLPTVAAAFSLWKLLRVHEEMLLPKPVYVVLAIIVSAGSLIAYFSLAQIRSLVRSESDDFEGAGASIDSGPTLEPSPVNSLSTDHDQKRTPN